MPLVVVDNGTRTIDETLVAEAAPGAELLALPENVGYTGGANVGIRHALATGADFVMLVNNDTILEPECLGELVRIVQSNGPRVAAVGAKVLCADEPRRLWIAYGRLTYGAALVRCVGQGEDDGPRFSELREVDWVSACAVLLSRVALTEVGLLDEDFFAYHDDVDWCTTARASGFRILFAPQARVRHRGGASLQFMGKSASAGYLHARNTVVFARKHARLIDRMQLWLSICGSLPLEYVRRRRRGDGAKHMALLMRGYLDGLRGREIPYRHLGLR
jgi:GT2 family glycosyltransferase